LFLGGLETLACWCCNCDYWSTIDKHPFFEIDTVQEDTSRMTKEETQQLQQQQQQQWIEREVQII